MAKDKTKDKTKGPKSVPNKHLHARISFLQQAATYLATRSISGSTISPDTAPTVRQAPIPAGPELDDHDRESAGMDWEPSNDMRTAPQSSIQKTALSERQQGPGISFHLSSHLRQVARKSQIRLHPTIKRVSCKVCNAVFVEGKNCRTYVENLSKGSKKQHADVLVWECNTCGSSKRIPIGTQRQQKKAHRSPVSGISHDTKAAS